MRNRRFISILLTLCLALSLLPTSALAASADQFTDVAKDAWYYEDVSFVVDEGYFKGMSDTIFAPEENVTRAQFVTVLARYAGVEKKLDATKSSFTDVPTGTWYTGAVTWAAENKIVNGRGNGIFDPMGNITREEMCTILDRWLEAAGETAKLTKTPAEITDMATVSAYATEAVENCVAYGVILGYPDGTFQPKATATRAHVAAILHRLVLKVSGPGRTPSGDPDYTAEAMEAAAEVADKYVQKIVDAAAKANELADLTASVSYDNAEVLVAAEGTLNSANVVTIAEMATEIAVILVSDTDSTKAELKETDIYEIVYAINDELSLGLGSKDVQAVAENVYERAVDAAKAVWAEFRNDPNDTYAFTDVIVKAGDTTLFTINTEGNTTVDLVENKKAAAKAAAKYIAKDLHADLIATEGTAEEPAHEVNLDAALDLEFVIKDEDYKEDCTTNFTLTCDVTLESNLVGYYFDGYDHLVVTITEDIQEQYNESVEAVIAALAQNPAFKQAIENNLQGVVAVDGMDLTEWFTAANVKAVLNGETDALDNTVLYAQTIELVNEAIENAVDGRDLGALINEQNSSINLATEDLNALLKDEYYSEAIGQVITLEAFEDLMGIDMKAMLEDAAAAEMDKLDAEMKEKVEDSGLKQYAVYGALAELGLEVYEDTAAAEFASEETQATFTAFVDDTIVAALGQEDVQEAINPLKVLEPFMTFADAQAALSEKSVAGIATLLENETLASYVDGKGDSYANRITNQIKRVPESAKISIGGYMIEKADLEDLRTATTTKEVRLALAELLRGEIGALKVADFAVSNGGVDITVYYKEYNPYTINVAIDVE